MNGIGDKLKKNRLFGGVIKEALDLSDKLEKTVDPEEQKRLMQELNEVFLSNEGQAFISALERDIKSGRVSKEQLPTIKKILKPLTLVAFDVEKEAQQRREEGALGKLFTSAGAGFQQIYEGGRKTLASITGDEEMAQEAEAKLTRLEQVDPGDVLSFIGSTAGQVVPSLVALGLASFLGPVAGLAGGATVSLGYGISSMGTGMSAAERGLLEKGEDPSEHIGKVVATGLAYGVFEALGETLGSAAATKAAGKFIKRGVLRTLGIGAGEGTEVVSKALRNLPGKAKVEIVQKFIKEVGQKSPDKLRVIAKSIGKASRGIPEDFVKHAITQGNIEGLEEVFTQLGQNMADWIYSDPELSHIFDGVLQSYLGGALGGAYLAVPSMVVEKRQARKARESLTEAMGGDEEKAKILTLAHGDEESYRRIWGEEPPEKIAKKASEKGIAEQLVSEMLHRDINNARKEEVLTKVGGDEEKAKVFTLQTYGESDYKDIWGEPPTKDIIERAQKEPIWKEVLIQEAKGNPEEIKRRVIERTEGNEDLAKVFTLQAYGMEPYRAIWGEAPPPEIIQLANEQDVISHILKKETRQKAIEGVKNKIIDLFKGDTIRAKAYTLRTEGPDIYTEMWGEEPTDEVVKIAKSIDTPADFIEKAFAEKGVIPEDERMRMEEPSGEGINIREYAEKATQVFNVIDNIAERLSDPSVPDESRFEVVGRQIDVANPVTDILVAKVSEAAKSGKDAASAAIEMAKTLGLALAGKEDAASKITMETGLPLQMFATLNGHSRRGLNKRFKPIAEIGKALIAEKFVEKLGKVVKDPKIVDEAREALIQAHNSVPEVDPIEGAIPVARRAEKLYVKFKDPELAYIVAVNHAITKENLEPGKYGLTAGRFRQGLSTILTIPGLEDTPAPFNVREETEGEGVESLFEKKEKTTPAREEAVAPEQQPSETAVEEAATEKPPEGKDIFSPRTQKPEGVEIQGIIAPDDSIEIFVEDKKGELPDEFVLALGEAKISENDVQSPDAFKAYVTGKIAPLLEIAKSSDNERVRQVAEHTVDYLIRTALNVAGPERVAHVATGLKSAVAENPDLSDLERIAPDVFEIAKEEPEAAPSAEEVTVPAVEEARTIPEREETAAPVEEGATTAITEEAPAEEAPATEKAQAAEEVPSAEKAQVAEEAPPTQEEVAVPEDVSAIEELEAVIGEREKEQESPLPEEEVSPAESKPASRKITPEVARRHIQTAVGEARDIIRKTLDNIAGTEDSGARKRMVAEAREDIGRYLDLIGTFLYYLYPEGKSRSFIREVNDISNKIWREHIERVGMRLSNIPAQEKEIYSKIDKIVDQIIKAYDKHKKETESRRRQREQQRTAEEKPEAKEGVESQEKASAQKEAPQEEISTAINEDKKAGKIEISIVSPVPIPEEEQQYTYEIDTSSLSDEDYISDVVDEVGRLMSLANTTEDETARKFYEESARTLSRALVRAADSTGNRRKLLRAASGYVEQYLKAEADRPVAEAIEQEIIAPTRELIESARKAAQKAQETTTEEKGAQTPARAEEAAVAEERPAEKAAEEVIQEETTAEETTPEEAAAEETTPEEAAAAEEVAPEEAAVQPVQKAAEKPSKLAEKGPSKEDYPAVIQRYIDSSRVAEALYPARHMDVFTSPLSADASVMQDVVRRHPRFILEALTLSLIDEDTIDFDKAPKEWHELHTRLRMKGGLTWRFVKKLFEGEDSIIRDLDNPYAKAIAYTINAIYRGPYVYESFLSLPEADAKEDVEGIAAAFHIDTIAHLLVARNYDLARHMWEKTILESVANIGTLEMVKDLGRQVAELYDREAVGVVMREVERRGFNNVTALSGFNEAFREGLLERIEELEKAPGGENGDNVASGEVFDVRSVPFEAAELSFDENAYSMFELIGTMKEMGDDFFSHYPFLIMSEQLMPQDDGEIGFLIDDEGKPHILYGWAALKRAMDEGLDMVKGRIFPMHSDGFRLASREIMQRMEDAYKRTSPPLGLVLHEVSILKSMEVPARDIIEHVKKFGYSEEDANTIYDVAFLPAGHHFYLSLSDHDAGNYLKYLRYLKDIVESDAKVRRWLEEGKHYWTTLTFLKKHPSLLADMNALKRAFRGMADMLFDIDEDGNIVDKEIGGIAIGPDSIYPHYRRSLVDEGKAAEGDPVAEEERKERQSRRETKIAEDREVEQATIEADETELDTIASLAGRYVYVKEDTNDLVETEDPIPHTELTSRGLKPVYGSAAYSMWIAERAMIDNERIHMDLGNFRLHILPTDKHGNFWFAAVEMLDESGNVHYLRVTEYNAYPKELAADLTRIFALGKAEEIKEELKEDLSGKEIELTSVKDITGKLSSLEDISDPAKERFISIGREILSSLDELYLLPVPLPLSMQSAERWVKEVAEGKEAIQEAQKVARELLSSIGVGKRIMRYVERMMESEKTREFVESVLKDLREGNKVDDIGKLTRYTHLYALRILTDIVGLDPLTAHLALLSIRAEDKGRHPRESDFYQAVFAPFEGRFARGPRLSIESDVRQIRFYDWSGVKIIRFSDQLTIEEEESTVNDAVAYLVGKHVGTLPARTGEGEPVYTQVARTFREAKTEKDFKILAEDLDRTINAVYHVFSGMPAMGKTVVTDDGIIYVIAGEAGQIMNGDALASAFVSLGFVDYEKIIKDDKAFYILHTKNDESHERIVQEISKGLPALSHDTDQGTGERTVEDEEAEVLQQRGDQRAASPHTEGEGGAGTGERDGGHRVDVGRNRGTGEVHTGGEGSGAKTGIIRREGAVREAAKRRYGTAIEVREYIGESGVTYRTANSVFHSDFPYDQVETVSLSSDIDKILAREYGQDFDTKAILAYFNNPERQGAAFVLANDAGLGKTFVALATAVERLRAAYNKREGVRGAKRVLIVVPPPILPTWKKIATEFFGLNVVDLRNNNIIKEDGKYLSMWEIEKRYAKGKEDRTVYITTYSNIGASRVRNLKKGAMDVLKGMRPDWEKEAGYASPDEQPQDYFFDYAIVDESHSLKNPSSNQSKLLLDVLMHEKTDVLAMSATPYQTVEELNPYIVMGLPVLEKQRRFPNRVDAAIEYASSIVNSIISSSASFASASDESVRQYVMLSRIRYELTKRGALIDRHLTLDGQNLYYKSVSLPPEKMALLNLIAIRMKDAGILNISQRLRHLVQIAKLAEAIQLVAEEAAEDPNRHIVVFTELRNVISKTGAEEVDALIQTFLDKNVVSYTSYDGKKYTAAVYSIATASRILAHITGEHVGVIGPEGDAAKIYGGRDRFKERNLPDELPPYVQQNDQEVMRLFNTPSPAEKVDVYSVSTRKTAKTRIVMSTVAAGGQGISLHDTDGNYPRLQINVALPYSGIQYDQVMGRTHRLGSKSETDVIWMFTNIPGVTDSIVFEGRPAKILVHKLRSMGALVSGAGAERYREMAMYGNINLAKILRDAFINIDDKIVEKLPEDVKELVVSKDALERQAKAVRGIIEDLLGDIRIISVRKERKVMFGSEKYIFHVTLAPESVEEFQRMAMALLPSFANKPDYYYRGKNEDGTYTYKLYETEAAILLTPYVSSGKFILTPKFQVGAGSAASIRANLMADLLDAVGTAIINSMSYATKDISHASDKVVKMALWDAFINNRASGRIQHTAKIIASSLIKKKRSRAAKYIRELLNTLYVRKEGMEVGTDEWINTVKDLIEEGKLDDRAIMLAVQMDIINAFALHLQHYVEGIDPRLLDPEGSVRGGDRYKAFKGALLSWTEFLGTLDAMIAGADFQGTITEAWAHYVAGRFPGVVTEGLRRAIRLAESTAEVARMVKENYLDSIRFFSQRHREAFDNIVKSSFVNFIVRPFTIKQKGTKNRLYINTEFADRGDEGLSPLAFARAIIRGAADKVSKFANLKIREDKDTGELYVTRVVVRTVGGKEVEQEVDLSMSEMFMLAGLVQHFRTGFFKAEERGLPVPTWNKIYLQVNDTGDKFMNFGDDSPESWSKFMNWVSQKKAQSKLLSKIIKGIEGVKDDHIKKLIDHPSLEIITRSDFDTDPDLIEHVKEDPELRHVKGFFDVEGNVVYIVLDNILNRKKRLHRKYRLVTETILHEYYGHFGVEAILGQAFRQRTIALGRMVTRLARMTASGGPFAKIYDTIARHYALPPLAEIIDNPSNYDEETVEAAKKSVRAITNKDPKNIDPFTLHNIGVEFLAWSVSLAVREQFSGHVSSIMQSLSAGLRRMAEQMHSPEAKALLELLPMIVKQAHNITNMTMDDVERNMLPGLSDMMRDKILSVYLPRAHSAGVPGPAMVAWVAESPAIFGDSVVNPYGLPTLVPVNSEAISKLVNSRIALVHDVDVSGRLFDMVESGDPVQLASALRALGFNAFPYYLKPDKTFSMYSSKAPIREDVYRKALERFSDIGDAPTAVMRAVMDAKYNVYAPAPAEDITLGDFVGDIARQFQYYYNTGRMSYEEFNYGINVLLDVIKEHGYGAAYLDIWDGDVVYVLDRDAIISASLAHDHLLHTMPSGTGLVRGQISPHTSATHTEPAELASEFVSIVKSGAGDGDNIGHVPDDVILKRSLAARTDIDEDDFTTNYAPTIDKYVETSIKRMQSLKRSFKGDFLQRLLNTPMEMLETMYAATGNDVFMQIAKHIDYMPKFGHVGHTTFMEDFRQRSFAWIRETTEALEPFIKNLRTRDYIASVMGVKSSQKRINNTVYKMNRAIAYMESGLDNMVEDDTMRNAIAILRKLYVDIYADLARYGVIDDPGALQYLKTGNMDVLKRRIKNYYPLIIDRNKLYDDPEGFEERMRVWFAMSQIKPDKEEEGTLLDIFVEETSIEDFDYINATHDGMRRYIARFLREYGFPGDTPDEVFKNLYREAFKNVRRGIESEEVPEVELRQRSTAKGEEDPSAAINSVLYNIINEIWETEGQDINIAVLQHGRPWFTKERTMWMPRQMFADYLLNDPTAVVPMYVFRAARMIELYRHFGVDLKVFNTARRALMDARRQGKITTMEYQTYDEHLRHIVEVLRGVYDVGFIKKHRTTFRLADMFRLVFGMSKLAWAGLKSIPELASLTFIRSRPKDALKAYTEIFGRYGLRIKRAINQMEMSEYLLHDLNAIVDSTSRILIEGRYFNSSVEGEQVGLIPSRAAVAFYTANMLMPITRLQTLIAMHAASFEVQDLATTPMSRWSKRMAKDAEYMFTFPITEDNRIRLGNFVRFARSNGLDAARRRYPEQYRWYKEAVYRAIRQMSVESTITNRPLFMSSHNPFKRMAGQLFGFIIAFQKQGTYAYLKEGLKNKHFYLLFGLIPVWLIQWLVQHVISWLRNLDAPTRDRLRREYKEGQIPLPIQVARFIDETGYFPYGASRYLLNPMQSVIYGKKGAVPVVEALAGPANSGLLQISGSLLLSMYKAADDPRPQAFEPFAKSLVTLVPIANQIPELRKDMYYAIERALRDSDDPAEFIRKMKEMKKKEQKERSVRVVR